MQHMIEAGEAALEFMEGRTRANLDTDRLLLFGVVRAVEVIGEAATRVSSDTRHAAPQIPWLAIAGMRNRLVHGYFDINAEIVWKTVAVEIPALLPALRSLLDCD